MIQSDMGVTKNILDIPIRSNQTSFGKFDFQPWNGNGGSEKHGSKWPTPNGLRFPGDFRKLPAFFKIPSAWSIKRGGSMEAPLDPWRQPCQVVRMQQTHQPPQTFGGADFMLKPWGFCWWFWVTQKWTHHEIFPCHPQPLFGGCQKTRFEQTPHFSGSFHEKVKSLSQTICRAAFPSYDCLASRFAGTAARVLRKGPGERGFVEPQSSGSIWFSSALTKGFKMF